MLRPSVRSPLLAAALAASIPCALQAQEVRILTAEPGQRVVFTGSTRPMLGVSTVTESERADTLGLLIDEVREDSPAARAGIKRGDRLQSINGVSLRAGRDDAGTDEYAGVLARRLTREMGKVKEGDEVTLVVFADGRARTVKVKPVSANELYGASPMARSLSRSADRAVLGVTIGSTGSARDTIGVFVSAVATGGPAEKAGIVEGDRIAAINGISLRVAREDAEDPAVGGAKAERLRREIERLEAGASVELTVVSAGRSRVVRLTTVKASELGGDFSLDLRGLAPAMREAIERIEVRRPEGSWSSAPTPPTPPMPPAAPLAPVRGTIRTRIQTI